MVTCPSAEFGFLGRSPNLPFQVAAHRINSPNSKVPDVAGLSLPFLTAYVIRLLTRLRTSHSESLGRRVRSAISRTAAARGIMELAAKLVTSIGANFLRLRLVVGFFKVLAATDIGLVGTDSIHVGGNINQADLTCRVITSAPILILSR